ncbi:hypothetical protein [Streptomyces sp. NPDC015345]|uniref:hypothetical protein n=1 Tax=Streptomyces sp. NPDC015345 TaxID=3364953 RepID=UPI00370089C9
MTVAVNHYGPVRVRLAAVNTSGTPGPPSEAVEATARRAACEDRGQRVVRRDHVAAGAITADLLDADAINGKITTGATVQTAAEGPRIVLNAARLRAIGTNGSAIGMEPNDVYPYIYWASVDGTNQLPQQALAVARLHVVLRSWRRRRGSRVGLTGPGAGQA